MVSRSESTGLGVDIAPLFADFAPNHPMRIFMWEHTSQGDVSV
jgi:hypothetical protein